MRNFASSPRNTIFVLVISTLGCSGGNGEGATAPGASSSVGAPTSTMITPVPTTPGPSMPPPTTAPPTVFSCADPAAHQAGPSPMRRLTRLQYANSVNDLLKLKLDSAPLLAEDEKVGAFDSNLLAPVGELHVDRYLKAAEAATDSALLNVTTLLPCDPVAVGEAACAGTVIDTLGPKAFRRPLSPDERTQYLGVYTDSRTSGDTFAEGIEQVVRSFLQSPYFLYLVEAPPAGAAATAVSPYEVASRLSYFLWNSMPDDTLFAAAAANQLGTPDALLAQAKRMLESDKATATLASFHKQWLGIDRLLSAGKDTKTFPEYTPELGQAMLTETTGFADSVIRKGDGKLATLFTLAQSPVPSSLLSFYGVQAPANATPGQLIALNPTERAGLLTQAGVLGAHSHFADVSPVLTGVFVRATIMCQAPPPPPPTVMTQPPAAKPGETTRQRFDRHRTDPSCANCHQLMDPIGYGFSHYDALGHYVTMDAGVAIDANGRIVGSLDLDGPFNGAVELSQKLATSAQVRECVMGQWFLFALGRNLDAQADGCSVAAARDAFAKSDYSVQDLLLSIVQSDSFRLRGVGGVQ